MGITGLSTTFLKYRGATHLNFSPISAETEERSLRVEEEEAQKKKKKIDQKGEKEGDPVQAGPVATNASRIEP